MKLNFPKSKKIYVTSDIHGGLELLQGFVGQVDGDSYLFILGDIFEKGIKSLETLRYVINLSKKKNVFVIKGNNDQAFLKLLEPDYINFFTTRLSRPRSIIYQMIKEIMAEGSPLELQNAIIENYQEEIHWLKNLDYYIEVDDFLFVHAGIDKSGFKHSKSVTMIGLDNFYEIGHNDNRIVICGHYPTAMYYYDKYDNSILIDETKKIISIDGGYGATNLGQLNMLRITKDGLKYYYDTFASDYYPTAKVIKSSKKIGNKRGVCFPNYELEVIKVGKYFSSVKVLNTSEVFNIKNELITVRDNLTYAIDDCPHNHLGVKTGDEVKVICDQYQGYSLICVNGECGWINKSCLQRGEDDV